MVSIHHKRKHDVNGRKMLSKICVGSGIDIGSADRPISPNAITLDIDDDMNPDIVSDMHSTNIKENSMDYVVASHVLEHTDRVIDALKEWFRILNDGGKIGIMVPHGEFVSHIDLGDSGLTHRALFTEKTLEIFLKHVGFVNVKSRRIRRPLANNRIPAVIAFGEKKNG